MRPANRALLARRFPALLAWIENAPRRARVEWLPGPHPALRIDGIQLASRFDPRSEAELQARLVPPGARSAALYGFAQGDLVRALLARERLEHLRVFVLDPSVARASLEHLEHEDWLADGRVELARASELSELALPFAASPACLRLAVDEAARVRDLVALELATPFIRGHQRLQEAELRLRMAENQARFAGDGEVGELFGTRRGTALAVAAAGPSLARHYDELRARARELIAVDAALRPLLMEGVIPALVVAQDPHEQGSARLFDLPLERLAGSCLVYFPVVPGGVLERWPGRRLAARGEGALYENSRPGVATLFSSGSVVHPAVDLAVRMGAAQVDLFGADFAVPGGRSHVAGAAWDFPLSACERGPWVLGVGGGRVASLPNLIGYLRDLERYIARRPSVRFVNRGREGAAIAGTTTPEEAGLAV